MNRLVPATGAALVLVSAAAVALLVAPPGRPADPPAPAGDTPRARPVVDSRARTLLDRAAAAPARTSYQGVQFVSAWTTRGAMSEVVDIDHQAGRRTTVHSAGTALGPGSSVTLQAAGTPSIAVGGAVGLLARTYSLAVVGSGEVAGRTVDIVAARRPGSASSAPDAARFWLDRESGLVLRREVYDAHGRTTRASAFVEVALGETTSAGTTGAAGSTGSTSEAWATSLDAATLAAMRRHGWRCPETLPGGLSLVDARRRDDRDVVHLSYSDGIASVSVFEQRGRLPAAALAGHRREAAGGHEVYVRGEVPRRVVWASDGTIYTVVADAPERTVDAVVAALPHRAAGDGPMGRLGRGLDRVASWFNPFG